ncbi:MAG: Rieske 2Fe-2S domain-containing protein [Ginsengibacter sp.]
MCKNGNWIKIADYREEIDFNDHHIACKQINGRSVCIINTKNGLKAFSSKCPHAGGDLSSGFLDIRGNIICPVHHYRFNLINGMDTNREGYFLKIFQTKENEDGIFIELA